MGLRQFNIDVREAACCHCDCVSNIRRGDSEGEIVFTYAPQDLAPIELQALATNVDSYPQGSSFLIFTSSDHVETHFVAWLEKLSASVAGKTVTEVIRLISTSLTSKLESGCTESPDGCDTPDGDDCMSDDCEFDDSVDTSDCGEEWDIDIDPQKSRPPGLPASTTDLESLKRFKQHLRQVSDLGIFVSFLGAPMEANVPSIFSLAIHVSKLRIPPEALEAWDLKNSDFVVILVKLQRGYLPFQEMLDLHPDHSALQFRFGKCTSPRPSRTTALVAFDNMEAREEVEVAHQSDEMHVDLSNESSFVPVFISESLNSLLNREFATLLFLRRSQRLSWDQALVHKYNTSRGNHVRTQSSEELDLEEDVNQPEDTLDNPTNTEWLQQDYALSDEENPNILLIAIQFALQRLVRCTKYCMVCHQRTNSAFEAVKPYVCDKSLCLYQYLSLGFGQSIEHEIINNPYVVDLLVSFFFSATLADRLRVFPQGLGLKCPFPGSIRAPEPHLKVDVCFETKTIKFNPEDFYSYRTIKDGHCVLLVLQDTETIATHSILSGGVERHVCLISSVQQCLYKFQILSTRTGPPNLEPLPEELSRATQATNPQEGWQKIMLFKYNKDLDELENHDQAAALLNMTYDIPSVLEMREYLMERPGRLLSSYKRMHTSALALLKWIVASNRSFIVQDAPVPDSERKPHERFPPNQNQVIGMGEDWMQFRFAQGSPDKEQVFIDELERHGNVDGIKKPYPSLFVWHGSPIGNWHSIIRTGLDFADQAHGRAFGNGVYFSDDIAISQKYSGAIVNNNTSPMTPTPARRIPWAPSLGAKSVPFSQKWTSTWPNSQLVASSAIGVCEIINEPNQFISCDPHYVIDKVEWIQCRYLFVRVNPTSAARALPFTKSLAQEVGGYLPQDPDRQIIGPSQTPLQIPFSAIPARRRTALAEGTSQNRHPAVAATDSSNDEWGWMRDDINKFLDSECEDLNELTVRHRRRSSMDSGMEMRRPSKLTTTMQKEIKASPTPNTRSADTFGIVSFKPGALDLESLPKPMLPGFASSSPAALRRLTRDIKELQRVQVKTELHTLGWFIDFDKLSNLFHWIVEIHSFDESLPLAQDMKRAGQASVVLEVRFGSSYPMSPPFVRIIRPRFLPFSEGGGGHVTMGGAICSELLTNSGWSPVLSPEKVFLDVRMNLSDTDPPARLDSKRVGEHSDYAFGEAVDAFRRAVTTHGWQLPDLGDMSIAAWGP